MDNLKIFNVYKHPTRGFAAVKVGYSWPAFFFGPFWMLINKLWVLAGLWFGLYFVGYLLATVKDLNLLDEQIGGLITLSLIPAYLALLLVPLVSGNKWREENLSKRGYELIKNGQLLKRPMMPLVSWPSRPNVCVAVFWVSGIQDRSE